MINLMDFTTPILVTPVHILSQVVTLVTVKVKNLNKDDFHGYYGSMALNKELFGRRRARNASLIDLLASPQVKIGYSESM